MIIYFSTARSLYLCGRVLCSVWRLALGHPLGMDDITCYDLTYDDLNPECEIIGLGLMI